MAIIDRIKYDASSDELVWRFPTDQIVWGSQLVVNEAQEAVFYKGGQALDVFGAGTYTLKTGNIPLLEKLVNIPFGGDTPFAAEVWFVNKNAFTNLRWGTKTPIQAQDAKYGLFIPVRAFGQYGIKIKDSRHFLTEIVGTSHKTTTEDIDGFLKGVITSKLSDIIAELLSSGDLNIVTLPTQIDETSEKAKEKLKETFEKYGLEIIEFFIESINVPEDDASVKKLKQALADKAEIDILGERYQQKRMLDIGEAAATNEGAGSGQMMGAGIGMGMGMNMAQMMGGMMAQAADKIKPQSSVEDPAIKLQKIKSLFDQGLITQDEFDSKKKDILNSI
ncbi:MAG: SPFH domain-containing protein [Spirochaetia bacterium]|nr:SPFH domain-containing protein [Spirochaetia bacterium]